MTETLTPWFSWPTVPVREGWYDWRGTAYETGARMHWNGRSFGYWHAGRRVDMADDESDQWRGLAREQQ